MFHFHRNLKTIFNHLRIFSFIFNSHLLLKNADIDRLNLFTINSISFKKCVS